MKNVPEHMKFHKNKGFTYIELICAILVVIILIAIGIPAAGAYRKELNIKKLDDVAREIYFAAQSRLTAEKDEGRLISAYNDLMLQGTEADSAYTPSGIVYVDRDDRAALAHMGAAGLDSIADGGYYIIEVDPSSGYVYAVFYSDKAFTYDDVKEVASRTKSERCNHDPFLGYYGGYGSYEGASESSMSDPTLSATLVNRDELWLNVSFVLPSGLSETKASTKINITIRDEHGGTYTVGPVSFSSPDANGDGFKQSWMDGSVNVLLDSMETGYDFHSITGLTPGDNIIAYAELIYSYQDKYLTAETTAVSNSLFAYKNSGECGIGNVRHLNNLRNVPDLVTAARQTADISFETADYMWKDGKILDTATSGPLTTFEPVENSDLDAVGFTYDGGGHEISDFDIVTVGKDGGIFGHISGWTIENTMVCDVSVNASGADCAAGGFIGRADGCTVDNCGVYVSDTENASYYSVVSASGAAGGLVGAAGANTDINKSFAAVWSVTGTQAGGLVGSFNGDTVTSSYADTAVIKGDKAGGFAGALVSGSVSGSYAVTENFASGTGTAAGFAGNVANGKVTSSYALVGGVATTDNGTVRYGFSPAPTGGGSVSASSCLYNTAASFDAAGGTGTKKTVSEIRDILNGSGWECDYDADGNAVTGALSHPYKTSGDYSYMAPSGKYPAYIGLRVKGLDHYGNWPTSSSILTFDANGGTNAPEPMECDNGTEVSMPDPEDGKPTRTGYRIIGWDTEPDGTGDRYVFGDPAKEKITVTDDTVLYAIWSKEYKVIYYYNIDKENPGSDVFLTDSKTYIENEVATVVEDLPDRLYYTFEGWSANSDAADADPGYEPGTGTFIMGASDKKLYAVWELAPWDVNVTVTVNNAPADGTLKLELRGEGKTIKLNHTADGVYSAIAQNGTYKVYLRNYDTGVTVKVDNKDANANLQLSTIKVNYTLDGSASAFVPHASDHKVVSVKSSSGETFTAENGGISSNVTMPVPKGTKWTVRISESGKELDYIDITASGSAENVDIAYYTITYYENLLPGAVLKAGTLPADSKIYRYYEYAEIPAQTPECTKDSIRFVNWNTVADKTGTFYEATTDAENPVQIRIEGTTYLYAQWKEGTLFVTYNLNTTDNYSTEGLADTDAFAGLTYPNISKAYSEEKYLAGDSVTAKTTDIVRTDYLFVGWNTKSLGTGTNYEPGKDFIIQDNVVLYAQWAYVGNYTIIYYGNGGNTVTGITDNTTFSSKAAGTTMAANGFSRGGYMFTGWNTAEDGSGTTYAAGAKLGSGEIADLKALADGKNTIKLYAQWKKQTTYTVTFQLEKMGSGDSLLVAYDGVKYEAYLTCEGGFNPPSEEDIIVYVDNQGKGTFDAGDQLSAIEGDYNWDPYTLRLTVPASKVRGNIKIVAGAVAGEHTLEYYLLPTDTAHITTGDFKPLDSNYGSYVTIPDASPTRSGDYVFVEWNTKQDGSGMGYKPGDVILLNSNTKLYGQWKSTKLVGGIIYNEYSYFAGNGATSAQYYLAKGETQTLSDGETMTIINNGGQPAYNIENKTFYYGIMLQEGEKLSDYKVEIDTGSGFKTVSSTNIKSLNITSSSTLKNTFPHSMDNCVFEYAADGFDYYYFTRNSTSYIADVERMRVTYIGSGELNGKQLIYDFDNGSRSSNLATPAYTSGTADFTGETGRYGTVCVHNGNVPTLDRTYANFFKQENCQADFTVYPDDNDYPFTGSITLTVNKDGGKAVSTLAKLFNQVTVDGKTGYRFNAAAMAELEPGEYRVTFDYDLDSTTGYDNDPYFILNVYDEDIYGYRYLQLDIDRIFRELTTGSKETHIQLADIIMCSDMTTKNIYKFEDSARVYQMTRDGSTYSNTESGTPAEDIFMLIDNNPRTKYCAPYTKNTNRYVIVDVGEGYQFSANLYGFLSYCTAADTTIYPDRCPNRFTYYASNDPSVLTNKTYITDTGTLNSGNKWIRISKYQQTVANDDPNRKLDMKIVGPFKYANYTLTYDLNDTYYADVGGTPTAQSRQAVWSSGTAVKPSGMDVTSSDDAYGDRIITFETPRSNADPAWYFLGWSEDKNATEESEIYTAGSHFDLIYDATLYAVWSRTRPTFSIIYYANLENYKDGPTTGMTSENLRFFPKNLYCDAGTVTLADREPELRNHRFVKWVWYGDSVDTHSASTGLPENILEVQAEYMPGQTITVDQNKTLYAVWEKAYHINIVRGVGYQVTTAVSDEYVVPNSGNTYTGTYTFTVKTLEGYQNTAPAVNVTEGTATLTLKSKSGSTYTYTLTNVKSDITVDIVPVRNVYTITVEGTGFTAYNADGVELTKTSGVYTFTTEYMRSGTFKIKPAAGKGISKVEGATLQGSDTEGSAIYVVAGVTGNMTTTVTLTDEHYSVSFDVNGGSGSIPSMTAYKGIAIRMPEGSSLTAPAGLGFVGWGASAGDKTPMVFAGDFKTFNADTKLYAVWSKAWTVTYHDYNGSTSEMVFDGMNASPATPERAGYTFNGWMTQPGGSTPATFSGITADMDVYAVYTPVTYNITYSVENGTFGGADPNPTTYDMEDTFTLVNPTSTRTGYEFAGWSGTGIADKATTVTISGMMGDRSYTANWQTKTYAITAMANNGTSDYVTGSVRYGGSTITISHSFTKGKEVIEGWYTAAEGGTMVAGADGTLRTGVSGYTDGSGRWIRDDGATLYAHWLDNPATVTVTKDGSAYTGLGSSIELVSNATSASVTGATEASGTYTFYPTENGAYSIYVNGTDTGVDVIPGSSATVNFVTVNYHENAASGTEDTYTQLVIAGSKINLSGKPDGFKYNNADEAFFIGWSSSTNYGSAAFYPVGWQMTVNAKTDVYAVWMKGIAGVEKRGTSSKSYTVFTYDLAVGGDLVKTTSSLFSLSNNNRYAPFVKTDVTVPAYSGGTSSGGWTMSDNLNTTSGNYKYRTTTSAGTFTMRFGKYTEGSTTKYLYTAKFTYETNIIGTVSASVSETFAGGITR